MYITYEQLCQMAVSLEAMHNALPWYRLDKKYTMKVMLSVIAGMIVWIEQRVKAEREEKCPDCGQFHSDLPDFRGN